MLRFVEMYRHIFSLLFLLILLCGGSLAQEAEERAITLYNQAQSAHERGDLAKAIELYREAASLLKEVTALKPDFARSYASLGTALMRIEDRAGAESALRRAVELDGNLSAAHIELAELLLSRKAYKEAEK